jgi:hypothetical protein
VNCRISRHPIYDAARNLFDRRGVHLKSAGYEDLRQAIHAEPAYQDLR